MQDSSPPDDAVDHEAGGAAVADVPDAPGLNLFLAAELQDNLMTVTHDLDRLLRLLEDAGEALSTHFFAASAKLQDMAQTINTGGQLQPGAMVGVMQDIAGAVTAMQFQDMSTQLITHTGLRIRSCADRLANDAFGDDGDGAAVIEEAPLRPNPVTQDEVDAGSVELF